MKTSKTVNIYVFMANINVQKYTKRVKKSTHVTQSLEDETNFYLYSISLIASIKL